jgi:hypothetical protein
MAVRCLGFLRQCLLRLRSSYHDFRTHVFPPQEDCQLGKEEERRCRRWMLLSLRTVKLCQAKEPKMFVTLTNFSHTQVFHHHTHSSLIFFATLIIISSSLIAKGFSYWKRWRDEKCVSFQAEELSCYDDVYSCWMESAFLPPSLISLRLREGRRKSSHHTGSM